MDMERKAMLEALQEMKSACLKMESSVGTGGEYSESESDGDMDNLDEMLQGKLQQKEEGMGGDMSDVMEDGEDTDEEEDADSDAFDPSSVSSFFKDKIGSARRPMKSMRMGMSAMSEKMPMKENKIKVMRK